MIAGSWLPGKDGASIGASGEGISFSRSFQKRQGPLFVFRWRRGRRRGGWRVRTRYGVWFVFVFSFLCIISVLSGSEGSVPLTNGSSHRGGPSQEEGQLELLRRSSLVAKKASVSSSNDGPVVSGESAAYIWRVLASCLSLRVRALFRRPFREGENAASRAAELSEVLTSPSAFQLVIPRAPPPSPDFSASEGSEDAESSMEAQRRIYSRVPRPEELAAFLQKLQNEQEVGNLRQGQVSSSSDEEAGDSVLPLLASKTAEGGVAVSETEPLDGQVQRAARKRASAVVVVYPSLSSETPLVVSNSSHFKSLMLRHSNAHGRRHSPQGVFDDVSKNVSEDQNAKKVQASASAPPRLLTRQHRRSHHQKQHKQQQIRQQQQLRHRHLKDQQREDQIRQDHQQLKDQQQNQRPHQGSSGDGTSQ